MHKNLSRILLALCLALIPASKALAIKATPHTVAVRQPDGSTLIIRIHGDENFHYTTTSDGFIIRRHADGYFHYVSPGTQGGAATLSGIRAHDKGKRTAGELKFVGNLNPATSLQEVEKYFPTLAQTPRKAPKQVLDQKKIRTRRLTRSTDEAAESQYLVILVKYADDELHYAVSDFERWLNEPGYAVDGGTGSVKDYYRDNSMGQFVPNFTVLGPYTLDHEETYYAANGESTNSDVNPEAMIIEAVKKAKAAHPELDFSQFDNDGDGYMDNVNVIYSGYGEASSGNEDDMWPHSYNLEASSQTFMVDGITVNNYSVSAELVGSSGTRMDGIGTFTHEFGHILGLRDLYDTDDYTDGLGINPGDYSLYASGSYNNSSRTPPYLMAFERMQMGWLTPTALSKAEDVELDPVYKNAARYIDAEPKLNPATQGYDWYVLENRQQTGWDKYIPAHGLLIYHYDYRTESVSTYWDANGPNNNARHLCLCIVPADGINDDLTRNGDTFPGTTGSTDFTSETHPDAVSWTGEKLRVPITNITEESDGIIRFQAKGGTGTRSFIRTVPPGYADISSTSLTIGAEVVEAKQNITDMGFVWSEQNDYPTTADSKAPVAIATTATHTLSGLSPATTYHVRAYMTLADGTTVYGASLPLTTEHATVQAPFAFDFDTWNGNEPERWHIIDHNGDGITWVEDASTSSIVYQADYWNDADDWLISEKMHIPARGALYLVRGVTDMSCVEKLDIMVSTRSRNIDDFHLVRQLTLADQFGEQAVDEIDLSDYAGEDVYVALVARSEKLQNSLWIWEVFLTNKLETPAITDFSATDGGLHVSWTPVDGAKYYYLAFSEVTDEVKSVSEFLPESGIATVSGDVSTGTGLLKFTGSGRVETADYPDGITSVQYLLLSSGTRGTSTLSVEGSSDGLTWQRIGELQRISSTDTEGTAVDLSSFFADTTYTRLRICCEYGGRLLNIRNFTITYNDGTVWNSLSEGRVDGTEINIKEKTEGEFLTGKKYAAEVYSGDGLLFYDASAPAFFQYDVSGIAHTTANATPAAPRTARTICTNGWVRMSGLVPGQPVSLYTADGRLLRRFVPQDSRAAVRIHGYAGVVIGRQ